MFRGNIEKHAAEYSRKCEELINKHNECKHELERKLQTESQTFLSKQIEKNQVLEQSQHVEKLVLSKVNLV